MTASVYNDAFDRIGTSQKQHSFPTLFICISLNFEIPLLDSGLATLPDFALGLVTTRNFQMGGVEFSFRKKTEHSATRAD